MFFLKAGGGHDQHSPPLLAPRSRLTGRCVCSGAWIITGGTHTGVMKHVGEAVKDYALSSSMQSQIVAIGVATWGIIHNRDSLVQPAVG